MKALDELGVADNTTAVFSAANGAEVLTRPDGGNDAVPSPRRARP